MTYYNKIIYQHNVKKLEINMRFPNVQDFDWKRLDVEEYTLEFEKEMIIYNINDIDATLQLYYLTRGMLDKVTVDFPGRDKLYNADKIKSRLRTSKKYNIDALNWSDVKIGDEINKTIYLKSTGLKWEQIKNKNSPRSTIYIKDIIPSYIRPLFKDKELLILLDILENTIIDVNKPKFDYIFLYKGMKISFGLGGIHSLNEGEIITIWSDEYYDERDVSSEYPQAIITLKAFPAHLGPEWLYGYKGEFDSRMALKPKKNKTIEDYGDMSDKKLLLNGGGYGKLGDKWSWQYDPLQKYRVTIKCQLDLLLYLQMLGDSKTVTKFDAVNTDSANIIYKQKDIDIIDKISLEWTEITNAILERTMYQKLVRRDINSYLVVKPDGSVKYKGIFEMDKELHKDHSFHIINIALNEYFVNGKSVEDTIRFHTNIYDFFGTIRVQGTKSGTWSLYHTYLKDKKIIKEKIQKINRYFVTSNPNSQIIKELDQNKNKWSYIEAGYNTKPMNQITSTDIKNYDINYNYYIAKTMKIINKIDNGQQNIGI